MDSAGNAKDRTALAAPDVPNQSPTCPSDQIPCYDLMPFDTFQDIYGARHGQRQQKVA
jgi:hypothetical protein